MLFEPALASTVQSRVLNPYAGGVAFDAALAGALITRLERITDVPMYGVDIWTRDKALERIFYLPGLEPPQAAVSLLAQKTQTTNWILEGPKTIAEDVWNMLHNANFGAGFEDFVSKFAWAFLVQDNGVFVELIGDAPPLKDANGNILVDTLTQKPIPDVSQPLKGAVLGIATLESQRCWRTGNPLYPVVYTDLNGKMHRMHASRVWYTADMPTLREDRFGVGFCAMSRAVSVAQRLFNWAEMSKEMMDDFPASGILKVVGMRRETFDQQIRAYEAGRKGKEQDVYRGLIALFFQAMGPNTGDIELIPFRTLWESFNQKENYDVLIDLTAMAFDMDRQELAPLSSSSLGSGAQSGTLRKTSRGKGLHTIMSLVERLINQTTPPAITFTFDFHDQDQDLQDWEIKQMKANVFLSLYTASNPDRNVNIDTVAVQTPKIGGAGNAPGADGSPGGGSQGAIDRQELRYLLVKEGVLPRELLQPDENLRPDWERFDDITVKAQRRFGPRIVLDKYGGRRVPHDARRFLMPVTKAEVAVA